MTTPWSDAQIEYLRTRQADRTKHPYTCGGLGPANLCRRTRGIEAGVLTPTPEGFVCPCGEYQQTTLMSFDQIDEVEHVPGEWHWRIEPRGGGWHRGVITDPDGVRIVTAAKRDRVDALREVHRALEAFRAIKERGDD